MNLIVGATGVLGSAIVPRIVYRNWGCHYPSHTDLDLAKWDEHRAAFLSQFTRAYLCAGTKGHAECEGNAEAFRADVDGNIRLAKHLLRQGAFVVFVSTDAVEKMAGAYARNRMYVELALIMQPNVAIVRPGKFDASNVGPLADLCIDVGENRKEGLHYWRAT